MTDHIEPALSPAQWDVAQRKDKTALRQAMWQACDEISLWPDGERVESPTDAGMIALFNAALPDSDPRKVTRERVQLIRAALEELEFDDDTIDDSTHKRDHRTRLIAEGRALAAALESYLPPESL